MKKGRGGDVAPAQKRKSLRAWPTVASREAPMMNPRDQNSLSARSLSSAGRGVVFTRTFLTNLVPFFLSFFLSFHLSLFRFRFNALGCKMHRANWRISSVVWIHRRQPQFLIGLEAGKCAATALLSFALFTAHLCRKSYSWLRNL